MGLKRIGFILSLCLIAFTVHAEEDVHVVPLRYIATGNTVTVATPGTAVQLDTASQSVSSCAIKASTTNTGNIYIGDSTVSNQWWFLDAGEGLELDIQDPSEIYIDADTADDKVRYVCVK